MSDRFVIKTTDTEPKFYFIWDTNMGGNRVSPWFDTESKARHALMARQAGVKDDVNHPAHYTSHPSGVECIMITEHMSFCLGNAVKYIWRAGLKGNGIVDLEKAVWYVQREIARRKAIG